MFAHPILTVRKVPNSLYFTSSLSNRSMHFFRMVLFADIFLSYQIICNIEKKIPLPTSQTQSLNTKSEEIAN